MTALTIRQLEELTIDRDAATRFAALAELRRRWRRWQSSP